MNNFCIPTSFEDSFIDKLAKLNLNNKLNNRVYEVYGSTKEVLVGSGRPAKTLQNVDLEIIERHIKKCHKNNIKFNFVMNGACCGGKEFDKAYLEKIISFVENLIKIKVDVLTISNPYLIFILKNRFPNTKICLSIIAGVGSIQEISIYEEMGVDRIVLDANINRDFKLLRTIRKKTNIDLEILANNPCLFKCPFRRYHAEIDSHISIKEKEIPMFPSVLCKKIRLKKFEEIIKSPWIRPEDTSRYSELGINYIKLGGRGKDTDWILDLMSHYINENDGNNFYQYIEKNGWDFFRKKNKRLKKVNVSIPFLPKNFLDYFDKNKFNCGVECDKCGYCKNIAKKHVKVNDQNIRDNYLEDIDLSMKKIVK